MCKNSDFPIGAMDFEERSDYALSRAPARKPGGADDIMKVTGHASPKMLKKYIKADTLEVVEKLTDKYEYFR